MSPTIESIAVEELDKELEPKQEALELEDNIVEPVIDIPERPKAKIVYKPRV